MKKYVAYSPDEILIFLDDPKDKIVYSILDTDWPNKKIIDQFCSDLSYDHVKAYSLLYTNGCNSKEFAIGELTLLMNEISKEVDKIAGK